MKTISISNGDIQLSGGKIQFAIGNNKLVQDITRWLEEPLGTGPTTPGFGSLLLGMIGQQLNNSSISSIQSEISRVLQLYLGQQILSLQTAQNSAQLSLWNKSEIIQSIDSVNVTVQNSSILANISITTLASNTIDLTVSLDNNGVNVYNG